MKEFTRQMKHLWPDAALNPACSPGSWMWRRLDQHHAFLLVGIGAGDQRPRGFVGGVEGLVGDAGGDVDEIALVHDVEVLEVGAVAEACLLYTSDAADE